MRYTLFLVILWLWAAWAAGATLEYFLGTGQVPAMGAGLVIAAGLAARRHLAGTARHRQSVISTDA